MCHMAYRSKKEIFDDLHCARFLLRTRSRARGDNGIRVCLLCFHCGWVNLRLECRKNGAKDSVARRPAGLDNHAQRQATATRSDCLCYDMAESWRWAGCWKFMIGGPGDVGFWVLIFDVAGGGPNTPTNYSYEFQPVTVSFPLSGCTWKTDGTLSAKSIFGRPIERDYSIQSPPN